MRTTHATEWSVHELTRLTGTTSRTLRHYDAIGLLPPSRTGANGYRFYDADALVRLQRILLLRDLGLGLAAIAEALDGLTDEAVALERHLAELVEERHRLERRIAAVRHTLAGRKEGGHLVPEKMFDGFDHTVHADEVTQRWGREAWESSDRWWRDLGDEGRAAFGAQTQAIVDAFADLAARDVAAGSPEAAEVAARHHAWLRTAARTVSRGYFLGLAEMYVADERFAATYGGPDGAAYVRDVLVAYAEHAAFDED